MSTAGYRQYADAHWIDALRGQGERVPAVLEELGDFLRRMLAKALGGRGDVREDDLDDFTQESLVRLMENVDRFRGDSAFTTWAAAVATRVAFTELRKRRVREERKDDFEHIREEAEEISQGRTASPEDAVSKKDLLSTLEQAIATELTDRQRTAVLAELRGLPTVEIAERMQTNQNALYKLHHDARKKLKAAILAAGFTAESIESHVAEVRE